MILTGVDQVSVNYGRPDQKALRLLDVAQARSYQAEGQFPEGSMGPKVRAALEFVEATGREVLITSAGRLTEAVRRRAGTRIVASAGESSLRRAASRKGA